MKCFIRRIIIELQGRKQVETTVKPQRSESEATTKQERSNNEARAKQQRSKNEARTKQERSKSEAKTKQACLTLEIRTPSKTPITLETTRKNAYSREHRISRLKAKMSRDSHVTSRLRIDKDKEKELEEDGDGDKIRFSNV